jgi:hypothetical protein
MCCVLLAVPGAKCCNEEGEALDSRRAGSEYQCCQYSRGEEIEAWLAAHPEVEVYAILDDDSDMLRHQPHFKTCFSKGGLTEKIAWQVQDCLRGDGKKPA